MSTTIIFLQISDFFHLINFQIRKIATKKIMINRGSKQDIKLFIIYSDDPNSFSFQSFMKQSKDKITSELDPK